jgi:hypothetical protein
MNPLIQDYRYDEVPENKRTAPGATPPPPPPSTPPPPQPTIEDTIIAANAGNLETVRNNLSKILNFDYFNQNEQKETILIRLADKGDVDLVKKLLLAPKRGRDITNVNLRNINGNSAIILT